MAKASDVGEYESYSLGYIPAEVDVSNSGSTNVTSSSVVAKLQDALDDGKIIGSKDRIVIKSGLRKPLAWWFEKPENIAKKSKKALLKEKLEVYARELEINI